MTSHMTGERSAGVIWHVGADASPATVNGVNAVISTVAEGLGRLGRRVVVIGRGHETRQNASGLEAHGVTWHEIAATRLSYSSDLDALLTTDPPDIVHLHSAFVPQNVGLGRMCESLKIPYVVTPHGGYLEEVFRRSRVKKELFFRAFDRPYLRRARAVTCVASYEAAGIARRLGSSNRLSVIANPVSDSRLFEARWEPPSGRPRILFLGRLDVLTKGIDRAVDLARRVPEADFVFYGSDDPRSEPDLARIKESAPENVSFRPPVFGAEKIEAIRRSTLYFQPSRWEAFPISLIEAMAAGVPVAAYETLGIAPMLADHEAILTLPVEAADAVATLRRALQDREQLSALAWRGRGYAEAYLTAEAVARQYADLYDRIVSHRIRAAAPVA